MRHILVLSLVASGCAASNRTVPFEARARGVRIYECHAGGEWVAKGTEAKLYDGGGKPIGLETAGPRWELADGSSVEGERVDAIAGEAPSVDCGESNEGHTARVAYDATYRFHREQSAPAVTPEGATAISALATTAGVAAGIWLVKNETSSSVTSGLVVTGASLVFLPSLGRAIGGDGGGTARYVGLRAAVLLGGGLLSLALGANAHGGEDAGLGALIGGGLLTGAAVGVIGLVDIFTTSSALQPARVQAAPAAVGDRRAPGVMLAGSF